MNFSPQTVQKTPTYEKDSINRSRDLLCPDDIGPTNPHQPKTTTALYTKHQHNNSRFHSSNRHERGQCNAEGSMVSTGHYAAIIVKPGNLHRKDAKFVVMAASSNNLELQLSQLAMQRATNEAVKDFAAMMVDHHTKASQEMKTLLSGKAAAVPETALLPMHRLQMETVTAAKGADFDKAFMRMMVDAHEEDVDEFEDETTDARDADIMAFATRMLPILQTHYTR